MNERFRVIITRNQIEYLEKLANIEVVLSRQRSGDYDFIIRQKDENDHGEVFRVLPKERGV